MAGSLRSSRRFDEGRIRVGDAEREGALAALREHYAQGRIDAGEFDERISAALLARTRGDLARLFFDLPGESRIWPPSPRRRAPDPWRLALRVFGAVTVSALVVAVIIAVVLVTLLLMAMAFGGFLWIVFVWWLLARGFGGGARGGRGCARWSGGTRGRRGRVYWSDPRRVTRV